MVRSPKLKLLSSGSTSITLLTVLLHSGNFAAWSFEYLGVDTIVFNDSRLFAGFSLFVCQESSLQFSTYFYTAREFVDGLLNTMDWHLLDFPCSTSATICWVYFQEPGHYLTNFQLKMLFTVAGHGMILARLKNGHKNLHMLLSTWVLEQVKLSLCFQFQQSSLLPDWYLDNHSIMARLRSYSSLKYNLLADIWSSRLL
jgi:hypothetical protein